jgi:hypothetical protein
MDVRSPARSMGRRLQSFDDIPLWDTRHRDICAYLEEFPAPLKILLKTKNDPFQLEAWIQHHLKIVGEKNLIIFDNMSDDPDVLSIYRRYCDVVSIFRFSAHHNHIHHVHIFADLYVSLEKTTGYFIVLDTDERLVLFENDNYYADRRIIEYIQANEGFDFFPGTWLQNTDWDPTILVCGNGEWALGNGLAWGKPLLRAKADHIGGFMNHNIQLDRQLFRLPFKANIFVLHLSHLSPRQRIAANMTKLFAYGLAMPGDTPETIAAKNIEGAPDIHARYVREIRVLLAPSDDVETHIRAELRDGCLKLTNEGTISYHGATEKMALDSFMNEPTDMYESAIRNFGDFAP